MKLNKEERSTLCTHASSEKKNTLIPAMLAREHPNFYTMPQRTSRIYQIFLSGERSWRNLQHISNLSTKSLHRQNPSQYCSIIRSDYGQRICMLVLIFIATCCLFNTSSAQSNFDQDCEVPGTEGDQMVYYPCTSSPEPLTVLEHLTASLEPPDATCGSNADAVKDQFCPLVSMCACLSTCASIHAACL